MADRDGGNPADAPDHLNHRLIEQRQAIPEGVAFRVRDEQRPLANGKRRLHPDPVQREFLQPDDVAVGVAQIIECCPLLAAPADVLSFVGADTAFVGRLVGFVELCAAGCADETDLPPSKCPPQRISVKLSPISLVSPSQNSIAGSGRMTHCRSAACRNTGQSKVSAQLIIEE